MMRKVNKDFNAPPRALICGFENMRQKLLEQKANHQFEGRIYNNAVKHELKVLYHNKCAYCENLLSDDEFTIEHYRPKKGGYSYYWLGYEWSNLLPVCEKCNQAKGDKFPVAVPSKGLPNSKKKSRVQTPQLLPNGDLDLNAMKANHPYLLDEKPYLLHPEIDEPKKILAVNYTGELISLIKKDVNSYSYKRAQQTITITNLNRDHLVAERRGIIEYFEDLLKLQTVSFLREKSFQDNFDSAIRLAFFIVFEIIERQIEDEREYTLTGWCCWENIKEILFKRICNDNQELEQMFDYALDLYMKSNGANA